MTNKEIEDVIKLAECQQKSFHRVSGKLSEQMIEALKQVKLCSMPDVVERLVAFQNFLILDGQLDIDPDEVEKNAIAFTRAT